MMKFLELVLSGFIRIFWFAISLFLSMILMSVILSPIFFIASGNSILVVAGIIILRFIIGAVND